MPIEEGTNDKASVSPMLGENITGIPDVPVLCHERDGGSDDRKELVDPLTPVSPRSPEEFPPRMDSDTRRGVTETRMPHDSGRRKRKRSQNRRRSPRRNDLADKVAPKVVNSVVCPMTSKIYNVLGSVATEGNAFKPHMIAVDTCSGYNLVRKADLPPECNRYVIRDAPLSRPAGANTNLLRLTAVVRLAVRLRNTTFHIPFVVAEQLAVPVLLGTAFIDGHVHSIDIDGQKLELRHGGSVSIVDGKGEPTPPARRHGRQTSGPDVRDEAPHAI